MTFGKGFKKMFPGQEGDEETRIVYHISTGQPIILNSDLVIIGNPAGTHIRMSAGDGVEIRNGETTLGHWQIDGDIFIGRDVSNPVLNHFSIFANGQTYNGEVVGAGDVLMGDNTAGQANIFFDRSAGRIYFRGGVTPEAFIDTDGAISAGGGDVLLDSEGVKIALPASYDPTGPDGVKFMSGSDIASSLAGSATTGGGAVSTLVANADYSSSLSNATALIELRAGDADDLDFSAVRVTAKQDTSTGHLIELIVDDGVALEVSDEAIVAERPIYNTDHMTFGPLSSTPAAPIQDYDGNVYVKGGKLVIQYDDGGTVRYKYLDLTGTGVTWVHTTTAP